MPDSRSISIIVRRVAPEIVRPLRAAILRPGRPDNESVYPLDDQEQAGHFAAIDEIGRAIGSASVFSETAHGDHIADINGERDPWRSDRAWRLRGMTVIESMRGKGVSDTLMRAVIQHVAERGGDCLWFHARSHARRFYERNGCAMFGDAYDVPHIGEHVFMWLNIGVGGCDTLRA